VLSSKTKTCFYRYETLYSIATTKVKMQVSEPLCHLVFRVLLDRMSTDWDDYLQEVDFTPEANETGWGEEYRQYVKSHHM
jgi:hypothetical protein